MKRPYGHLDGVPDIYSHRTEGYSIVDAQENIFLEQLIRDYLYEVSSEIIRFNTSTGVSELEILLDTAILAKFNAKKFRKDRRLWYICLEPSPVCVYVDTDTPSYGDDEVADKPELGDVRYSKVAVNITYVNTTTRDNLVGALLDAGLTKKTKPDKLEIGFGFPSTNGVRIDSRFIDKMPLSSVKNNYTPAVFSKCMEVISRVKESQHGLVLLSGPVGTGKTYMIKAMLTEMEERTPIICVPARQFLTQVQLLTDTIVKYKKSIVILEDLGDLLSVEASSEHAETRANLLNISEGLLSLVGDTVLVFTFNHAMEKIDPAVTRPGRCLGAVEFGKLPYEQVQKRLSFPIARGDYSLAELYEMLRTGKPMTPQGDTLGFRTRQ